MRRFGETVTKKIAFDASAYDIVPALKETAPPTSVYATVPPVKMILKYNGTMRKPAAGAGTIVTAVPRRARICAEVSTTSTACRPKAPDPPSALACAPSAKTGPARPEGSVEVSCGVTGEPMPGELTPLA